MILRCANCGAEIADDDFLREAPCGKCGSLSRTIQVTRLPARRPSPAPHIASWSAVTKMRATIVVINLIAFVLVATISLTF